MNSTVPTLRYCAAAARRTAGGADLLAQALGQVRRRRLLDDLLKAPLHGTLALEEMDRVALPVADHLHLDVARPVDIGLRIDPPVTEIALRFARSDTRGSGEFAGAAHDAHALAAAARRRLDQQRETDRFRRRPKSVDVAGGRHRRRDRHALRAREIARGDLVAHQIDRLRIRSDENQTGVLDRLREARILGEKAVAGMDGVGAGAQRGVDDLAGIEMRGHRGLARYLDGLVGHAGMARASLDRVMDRDRAEPDRSQGSQDATGDLATIGDEHLREREGSCAHLGVADAVHRRAMSGEVCTGSVSVHSSGKPPGSSHEAGTGSGKSISG